MFDIHMCGYKGVISKYSQLNGVGAVVTTPLKGGSIQKVYTNKKGIYIARASNDRYIVIFNEIFYTAMLTDEYGLGLHACFRNEPVGNDSSLACDELLEAVTIEELESDDKDYIAKSIVDALKSMKTKAGASLNIDEANTLISKWETILARHEVD